MDPELLAQILAAQQPTLSPSALLATQGGVSRTTLGQLTDPNILLGTGVTDPMMISAGLGQFLSGRQQQVAAKARDEYMKAIEKYNNDIRALEREYKIEPPKLYSEVLDRYVSAPPAIASIFDQVRSGAVSANQAITSATTPLTQDELLSLGVSPQQASSGANQLTLKGVLASQGYGQTQWDRFSNDLQRFDTEAAQYRRDLMKYEDESASARRTLDAELIRLGGAPTPEAFGQPFDVQQERLQYFKDIGLPGLALLPDPSETYQVPRESVLATRRAQRGGEATLAEELLARERGRGRDDRRAPSGPTLVGGPVRRAAGERVPLPADVRGIGTPVSEVQQAQRGGVPFVGSAARSPALRRALSANTMTREQLLQEAVRRERENAELEASALGRGLARAGRTPFQDAMRQLYQYGLTEAGA